MIKEFWLGILPKDTLRLMDVSRNGSIWRRLGPEKCLHEESGAADWPLTNLRTLSLICRLPAETNHLMVADLPATQWRMPSIPEEEYVTCCPVVFSGRYEELAVWIRGLVQISDIVRSSPLLCDSS